MSGEGILDTSAFIMYERLVEQGHIPNRPLITTITLAELSVGPLVTSDDSEAAIRQAHLQHAESDFEPLPFDRAAARALGEVAADLRASGSKVRARAYDALIAAIAISRQLPLYTLNPREFRSIKRLNLVPIQGEHL